MSGPGSGDDELAGQSGLAHDGDKIGGIDETYDGVGAGESGAFSQAYSAPESEQFVTGPYVPVDPLLYDYDSYTETVDADDDGSHPRWPWAVGVTTIVAAVALVVSVALLVARSETSDLATPETTTSLPPVQDEIITTTMRPLPPPPPPPPPPPVEEPPPPPPPVETPESPPPPPVEEPEPPPATSAPPATTTTTTAARPRQVTYSVTGTKAPFDQITITYIDASGQRRTQTNAYIPWSLTLTPISQSEVGSVEASSLLRLSKLNCTITTSDGTVLSSNSNDAPQTSC